MPIEVTSEPERIVIGLSGMAVIGAMRRRVEIPTDEITSVSVRPRKEVKWGKAWLRMPGIHLPGVIRYGSYGVGAGREFWATMRESDLVVIEASGGPYCRIILGLPDPHGVAGAITAAMR